MSKGRTRHKRRDRRKAKMLLKHGVIRVPSSVVGHHASEYVRIKQRPS